jgi:hypothetical protein
MKMKFRKTTLAAMAVILTGIFVAQDAAAIPAFARKYGLSCSTCHAPMPRLKDYGDEFAGNGFRLPDGEEPQRAYRDVGDDMLTLQRELPLAVRLDAYGTFQTNDQSDDMVDMKTPWGLKLLSGGSVAPDVGYYFYFYMSEKGEVAGVEDAYLHFNDLGGVPFDVMVGQFQISDPMMKRELRLTFEDYQAYRVAPGASRNDLTYDRGVMVTYDTPIGVGLLGQVVNGNGKGEAEDGNFDSDPDKGYGGRVTYSQGPVKLGTFGYYAKESIDDYGSALENEVTIFGPDLHLSLQDKWSFNGQYLYREDSNPLMGFQDVETQAVVAELTLQPWGPDAKDTFVLLYNWVDSDMTAAIRGGESVDFGVNYETWTASWSHLHRRNLRMVAEYTYDAEIEESRAVIGFVSAF